MKGKGKERKFVRKTTTLQEKLCRKSTHFKPTLQNPTKQKQQIDKIFTWNIKGKGTKRNNCRPSRAGVGEGVWRNWSCCCLFLLCTFLRRPTHLKIRETTMLQGKHWRKSKPFDSTRNKHKTTRKGNGRSKNKTCHALAFLWRFVKFILLLSFFLCALFTKGGFILRSVKKTTLQEKLNRKSTPVNRTLQTYKIINTHKNLKSKRKRRGNE